MNDFWKYFKREWATLYIPFFNTGILSSCPRFPSFMVEFWDHDCYFPWRYRAIGLGGDPAPINVKQEMSRFCSLFENWRLIFRKNMLS
ncbi:hypothetical protein DL95DRAFT_194706 [Leptodontidium sp. 2 PMI_412]|nr:hypothetical protein DL95DRAFT_194706 [Leptodontidium sp. 2 PMI_412]